jgi:hypothetical protein
MSPSCHHQALCSKTKSCQSDKIIKYVTQEVQDNNNKVVKWRALRSRLQCWMRLWISVLTWSSCVLNILHPIFLSLGFKLNCANFDGISVNLTTSPKSKFTWATFGLLPQMLTWVSILLLIMYSSILYCI